MKKLVIVIAVIIGVILAGCTSNKVEEENAYEIMGSTLSEVEDRFTNFIIDTYMPSKNYNKEDVISEIEQYLSKTEYNNLLGDMGEYDSNVKCKVSSLDFRYGLDKNSDDTCDTILISFILEREYSGETTENRILITFDIRGDKVTNHSIYTGSRGS